MAEEDIIGKANATFTNPYPERTDPVGPEARELARQAAEHLKTAIDIGEGLAQPSLSQSNIPGLTDAKEVVVKTTPYDYYIEKIQDDIKYWKRDMRAAKRDISAARARLEKYAEQVSNAEETLNVLLKVAAMYEPGP
jgi:hypothetical protein